MINERPVADAAILPMNGTLLIPGDDVAVFDVSRCAADGSRLVLLDLATLRRIDAALILSRNVPPSVAGQSRLLSPTTTRVAELLHQRGIRSVGPTVRAELETQARGASGRRVPRSGVGRRFARWWDELWNVIYRVAAAACDGMPL
jgi:hypothetical protein